MEGFGLDDLLKNIKSKPSENSKGISDKSTPTKNETFSDSIMQ